MTLLISQYYKPKKLLTLYLETDEEIKKLSEQVKTSKKAFFTTGGRDDIKAAWNTKAYNYVIWAYQTNQDDRWCVIVLDNVKHTARIHTSTTAKQAEKEKKEIVGFLMTLNGLTNAENPHLDTDIADRTPKQSGFNAILYIKKLLERISKDRDISNINADRFNEPKESGKSKLQIVEEKFEALRKQTLLLPSLEHVENEYKKPKETTTTPITASPIVFKTKTPEQIKGDIEKLLTETENAWNIYLNTDPLTATDIKIRMFKDFRETARTILPFIRKALESKKELADFKLLDREWGNDAREYDINRDWLNAWYTLRIYLNEWDEALLNPIASAEMSPEDKKKLDEYDKLKLDKEKKDRENILLKSKNQQAQAEVNNLRTRKTIQPPKDVLSDDIQFQITQAYNSADYLNGYYRELMKSFLNWEWNGTDEQKNAIQKTKAALNKCINYLSKASSMKLQTT